jgi:Restriction endonuclease BsobI
MNIGKRQTLHSKESALLFNNQLPLIFVGAAIEAAMAVEIFAQYQNGTLANCANLTNDEQLASACEWLVSL